jgi:hypothetical protein
MGESYRWHVVYSGFPHVTLQPSQTKERTMKTILEYAKQESTWRGIIAITMAFGIQLDPNQQGAILTGGLALIGLINAFKKS